MEWNPPGKPMLPKDSGRSSDGTTVCYANRRSEERVAAEGQVMLSLDEPVRQEITGRLIDYSKSGFRAVHERSDLHTGQLVRFRHIVASGTAQVIWNRILPGHVESGFLVLPAA